MAKGQNTLAVGVSLVQAAPAIVEFFKLFRGDHSGAQTKAAAITASKAILSGAGMAALANNPKFNEMYGSIIQAAYDASTTPSNAFDPETVEIPGTPRATVVGSDSVAPKVVPKPAAKRKR